MNESLYDVLGVGPEATAAEIHRAYRRRSAKAHPDREGGSETEQQRLNDAYAVLSDPGRRAAYDATGDPNGKVNIDEDALNLVERVAEVNLESELDDYVAATKAKIAQSIAGAQSTLTANARKVARLNRKRRRLVDRKGLLNRLFERKLAGLLAEEREAKLYIRIATRALEFAEELSMAPVEEWPRWIATEPPKLNWRGWTK